MLDRRAEPRIARVGAAASRSAGAGTGASRGPLGAALDQVTDAARRVVRDEVDLLRLELQERGGAWLRVWLLARIALPLAGLAWLGALASLATLLARRVDWPLVWLALALINLGAALAFAAAAGRALRRGEPR